VRREEEGRAKKCNTEVPRIRLGPAAGRFAFTFTVPPSPAFPLPPARHNSYRRTTPPPPPPTQAGSPNFSPMAEAGHPGRAAPVLKERLGYDQVLQPPCRSAVSAVLAGPRQNVGVLPTGGSKSLLLPGSALIDAGADGSRVAPSISLMKDQVDHSLPRVFRWWGGRFINST